ncbi:hypothetical protein [Patulibacter defluvii]|uniref:hypothetical protein n=1 Tax=Patulibacter defluvii TaxID=3095358 RepID=UPI002A75AC25|nr:hypothetical protein [Patulibacter sp. DM4]
MSRRVVVVLALMPAAALPATAGAAAPADRALAVAPLAAEAAGYGGFLAWTAADGIAIRPPQGAVRTVRLAHVVRLSAGPDERGRPIVLAIACPGRRSSCRVVRIDARSGRTSRPAWGRGVQAAAQWRTTIVTASADRFCRIGVRSAGGRHRSIGVGGCTLREGNNDPGVTAIALRGTRFAVRASSPSTYSGSSQEIVTGDVRRSRTFVVRRTQPGESGSGNVALGPPVLTAAGVTWTTARWDGKNSVGRRVLGAGGRPGRARDAEARSSGRQTCGVAHDGRRWAAIEAPGEGRVQCLSGEIDRTTASLVVERAVDPLSGAAHWSAPELRLELPCVPPPPPKPGDVPVIGCDPTGEIVVRAQRALVRDHRTVERVPLSGAMVEVDQVDGPPYRRPPRPRVVVPPTATAADGGWRARPPAWEFALRAIGRTADGQPLLSAWADGSA